jgi:hypothetical protein
LTLLQGATTHPRPWTKYLSQRGLIAESAAKATRSNEHGALSLAIPGSERAGRTI